MWQFMGTLAISAFGGAFLVHYLKNFLFQEKTGFSLDWDGLIERLLITWLIVAGQFTYLIPLIVIVKTAFRLYSVNYLGIFFARPEPGLVPQKVRLKSDLALELLLSPIFAITVGVIF